jgi:uncharacterized protein YecE (DUF72 family)
MAAHVGISGWVYPGWRDGVFYPKDLVQKNELKYASQKVSSIEINSTFYRLQSPTSFKKWYAEVPKDFCFSVKAPQIMTHLRRLKDVDTPLANFMASGILALEDKFGCILWQFPPNVMLKDSRFSDFFAKLPHDAHSACKLGQKHSDFLKGKTYLEAKANFPIRHAFEFRHKSFLNDAFLDEMRKHKVALVLADAGKHFPYTEELTGDHVYMRMHGQTDEYKKGYTSKRLKSLAKSVNGWTQEGRPVYVYFDSDIKETAPKSAQELIKMLNGKK